MLKTEKHTYFTEAETQELIAWFDELTLGELYEIRAECERGDKRSVIETIKRIARWLKEGPK